MITKKLVNRPEAAVDESLQGFVAANPHLRLLEVRCCKRTVRKSNVSPSQSEQRIVIRFDIEEYKRQKKVTIICGGGSGHGEWMKVYCVEKSPTEPVFGGYVGRGFLSAAVAGNVFASPSTNAILHAIRAVECEGEIGIHKYNQRNADEYI